MISRLQTEAAEEADAKAFCDKETSESKAKQAELTASSDKSQVRIEKATALDARGRPMRFSMPWWFWNLIGAQGVFLLRRGGERG